MSLDTRQAPCAASSVSLLPFFSIELYGPTDAQPEALSSASVNPFKPNNVPVQTLVTSQPSPLNVEDDTSKEDVIFF